MGRTPWIISSTSWLCWGRCVRLYARQPKRRGGCLLPDYLCTKTGQPVTEVLQEEHPGMCIPPVENTMCASFKEYEDVPELAPLEFTEDGMT